MLAWNSYFHKIFNSVFLRKQLSGRFMEEKKFLHKVAQIYTWSLLDRPNDRKAISLSKLLMKTKILAVYWRYISAGIFFNNRLFLSGFRCCITQSAFFRRLQSPINAQSNAWKFRKLTPNSQYQRGNLFVVIKRNRAT